MKNTLTSLVWFILALAAVAALALAVVHMRPEWKQTAEQWRMERALKDSAVRDAGPVEQPGWTTGELRWPEGRAP